MAEAVGRQANHVTADFSHKLIAYKTDTAQQVQSIPILESITTGVVL